MSLIKGHLNAANLFTAHDGIRGLQLIAPGSVPSYWSIETGDGIKYFFWVNDDDELIMHTSAPTAGTAGTGSVIVGASNTGASKALDNLSASTAIDQDLNITDDKNIVFGASSDVTIDWKAGGGLYIDFAAGNSMVHFGNTNASDWTFHGGTDTSDAGWCASDDTFQICDDAILQIGGSGINTLTDGFTFVFDGSALDIDAVTAEDTIIFGSSANTDIRFESQSAAGKDVFWDASAFTFTILDGTILGFGTGDGPDYDIGMLPASTPSLSFVQAVSGQGVLLMGVDGKGIDQTWYGDTAGDYMKWDENGATNGALLFEDTSIIFPGTATYTLALSGNSLLLKTGDNAASKLILGQTGTNGMDIDFLGASSGDHVKYVATGTWTFTDVPVTMTGADSSGVLLDITGIDTTGNSNSVNITHSGTGYGLAIDAATTDAGAALYLLAKASQTTSLAIVDGATANWSGADDVGMVHISGDANQAHTGASLLYVTSTNLIDDCEGGLARFIDMAGAGGGTEEYAVEIYSDNNAALHVSKGLALFAGAATVSGTLTASAAFAVGTTSTFTGDATFLGGAGAITVGADSATQGTLTLWDGGGGNTPGYIILYSPNGTANYLFIEDDGTVKRHTSAPTQNSDGSEVGSQS